MISVQGFELATMTGTNVLVITQSKTGLAEIYVSDRTWAARLGVDVESLQRTCGIPSRSALSPQSGKSQPPICAADIGRAGTYSSSSSTT